MNWKRPESVPIGQVWSRFKGKERDGKPARTYQIRDMDDSCRQTCLDLMKETFLRDEPLCAVTGVPSDPDSIQSIVSNWEALIDQGVSLACFTDVDSQPGELVGFNITYVKSKDDEEEDFEKVKGEAWKKILRTLITTEELVDVFELYNVDKYMSSSGLTVLPSHRGQNIGARLFEARKPLCKALGIQASATVFTAISSQVLAAHSGFELLAELRYQDMLKYGIDLTASPTNTAKVMGIKYQFD